jgi:hypothetical protein
VLAGQFNQVVGFKTFDVSDRNKTNAKGVKWTRKFILYSGAVAASMKF